MTKKELMEVLDLVDDDAQIVAEIYSYKNESDMSPGTRLTAPLRVSAMHLTDMIPYTDEVKESSIIVTAKVGKGYCKVGDRKTKVVCLKLDITKESLRLAGKNNIKPQDLNR